MKLPRACSCSITVFSTTANHSGLCSLSWVEWCAWFDKSASSNNIDCTTYRRQGGVEPQTTQWNPDALHAVAFEPPTSAQYSHITDTTRSRLTGLGTRLQLLRACIVSCKCAGWCVYCHKALQGPEPQAVQCTLHILACQLQQSHAQTSTRAMPCTPEAGWQDLRYVEVASCYSMQSEKWRQPMRGDNG